MANSPLGGGISSLPLELYDKIVACTVESINHRNDLWGRKSIYEDVPATLKRLRLVNRSFYYASTRLLFRRIDASLRGSSDSLANVDKIARSDFASVVSKLIIGWGGPCSLDEAVEFYQTLPEIFSLSLTRFENLRWLAIGNKASFVVEQPALTERLLKALADHPPSRLEGLQFDIGNVPCTNRRLALLAPVMSNLRYLYLLYSDNYIYAGDSGLFSALQHGRNLQHLCIRGLFHDANASLDCIPAEAPLRCVQIAYMNISFEGIRAILKFARTLVYLDIARVNLTGGTWAELVEELSNLPLLSRAFFYRCSYAQERNKDQDAKDSWSMRALEQKFKSRPSDIISCSHRDVVKDFLPEH
ncbi:hypothetical protein P170DRAFT_469430 [Aspergillus steynii IBT 23096]|uniref:F-box domain-containing protein n=1 Tax=Aspergillus steynii IBT 23096 TaxID=1392250 RepID=A0A2I2GM36_9EURO|nr:uncharacterized protein P170DRAFT_469430 [Aspergillus steynii IBT 23096]PLB53951.1 hypothetical protein P170DRAFT_469430 [Aspergillus steynii IBT 23096]